jgi:hypothetical protein
LVPVGFSVKEPLVEERKMPLQKPGEQPARPGEYLERGPRGGEVSNPRQVTIEPGDKPLPPTQQPGRTWERVGPPKD